MKKIIFALTLLVSVITVSVPAKANTYSEPYKIRCTCYTADADALTADGSVVKDGVIAGKSEYLGCVAILYRVGEDSNIGDCIGFYEFRDTGGHEELKDGTRVDLFRASLDECYDWVAEYGDYVYIQIVKAEG